MGLLYGWLDSQDRDAAETVLRNMIDASTVQPPEPPVHCHTSTVALGGQGLWLHRQGSLCAAIEGHPRWHEPALAALADEQSPAAALAEGYRRFGNTLFEHLGGDFALAVLDPDQRTVLLAIDRVGIRPLAWTRQQDRLIFGSQLSGLLAHPAVPARIRPQGVFDYLYFHMVPSPDTLFEGLHKLRPGELLEYRDGRVETRFYWQLQFSESPEPRRTLNDELHRRLRECVAACTDLPSVTGTFLSGGLDSSTVTGVLQQLQADPVDAYAIGFDAEGFDEMEYARATARHFGARLHEYYVTPSDVLQSIPLAAAAYDEPFGNASAIPAYFCARTAREAGKSVLLAGDGGDEIFAGNARYAKQKLFQFYDHVPSLLKAALIEPAARHLPPLRKLKSYIEQARVPMPERLETYNFLHRFALEEIFAPEFLQAVDGEAPIRQLRAQYRRAGEDTPLVKKMLFLDHKFTLADNDLRKVNRMCELAGIDVRYPLLQDEMMAFAARVPARRLLQGLQLRAFYRKAMKGFLARETLEKHKHGFGLPFGLWMKEYAPLKAFAHERLEGIQARGFLNDRFIGQIIHAQETGHATYYGVFIWVLIMLEEWLQSHHRLL